MGVCCEVAMSGMFDKLQSLEDRYQELEHLMAQQEVLTDFKRLNTLAKERASLEELVSLYREYKRVTETLQETQELLTDGDPDVAALAREELEQLHHRKEELEQQVRLALVPKDPNDERDVIVELRAGTGGEEAGLFAAELLRMYARYAQTKGWKMEVINSNETGLGGIKEAIFEISGRGAYSRLKHESGVHRVQRIPVTEASDRIHTSAATVAVLPEAEEVEVQINPDDLRIDIFHAGGAGGQNVNKVATAVRITHLSTGIVAVCQDERSQLKNKTKAMAILRARILAQEMSRQQEEITATRRSQVGTGERSEKVRTYNFPQDRVTDHRLGMTIHSLSRVLDGDLDEFIDNLIADEQARRLQGALV